jgi:DNA topoisomerase IB
MQRKEAKHEEIALGETICVKLRNIYHSGIPWVDCHKAVAHKFSALKAISRKFYVGKTDIEILKELYIYDHKSLEEAFNDGI